MKCVSRKVGLQINKINVVNIAIKMSSTSKATTHSASLSVDGIKGEVSRKVEETKATFPFGCQWGCKRQNVVSQPGNSCGRPECNRARDAQSLGKGYFSTHPT